MVSQQPLESQWFCGGQGAFIHGLGRGTWPIHGQAGPYIAPESLHVGRILAGP